MFGFKDRTGFKAIVYKNVDGVVVDRVVEAEEAVDLAVDGWSMSPASAHPDEDIRNNEAFIEQAGMIGTDRMRMLNLPMIKDKEVLQETAKRWLGIKLNPKHNVRSMKERMIACAKREGVWEDSDGNS